MEKLTIVFAGTPEPAAVALERLVRSGHQVAAVITRPDAPRGRGRALRPSPVAECAAKLGIETLKPRSLRPGKDGAEHVRARLAEIRPDVLPVVAYGNLITPDLLDIARFGWVNLHFSLLPRWRGAAPVQAALAAGDTETGVSVFRIEEGLDTGPVLATAATAIGPEETADDLLTRLAYLGADTLAETLDALAAGEVTPQEQTGEPSYAAKITPDDARIDWTSPAAVLERRVRAHTPAPGAWTMWQDKRMKISPVQVSESLEPGAAVLLNPGEVRVEKDRVLVGTGDIPVTLGKIQPPGKKRMAAVDWARGAAAGKDVMFQ